MKMTILSGEEAVRHLQEPAFIAAWTQLLEQCPWATACQSPAFVLTWYGVFQRQYTPLLVMAYATDQSLTGLLTLAYGRDPNQLIAAGGIEAEYQAWLEQPGLQGAFMQAALHTLYAAMPHMQLRLQYLLPDIPLGWLAGDTELRRHCLIRPRRRPIMQVNHADTTRRLSSKNNKRVINKLKRSGEIRFKRLTDPEEFAYYLDDAIRYYDLRQGALYTVCPFKDQPLKKPFLLALFSSGLLHATMLQVGAQTAAFHLGLQSKACVHLGIIAHSPFFAHAAPGRLHLLMLGNLLAEEQVTAFDLTPGSGYKDLLATGHDEVRTLTFYPSHARRFKAHIYQIGTRLLSDWLHNRGISPRQAYSSLEKGKAWMHKALSACLRPLEEKKWIAYSCRPDHLPQSKMSPRVACDKIDELLQFSPARFGQVRQVFLTEAMQRLEGNLHVYTRTDRNGLQAYCWAVAPASVALIPGLHQPVQLPAGASVIFDCQMADYDGDRQAMGDWLLAIAQHRCCQDKNLEVYVFADAQDRMLQTLLEQIGFTQRGFLRHRRILGRHRQTVCLPPQMPVTSASKPSA